MQKDQTEFEEIVMLIMGARNRAFRKVNAELVLLYYNVGKIVFEKVAAGSRGEGTVDELAKFIAMKLPELRGFNRRGLYRMKQFFETYSIKQFVAPTEKYLESYLTTTSSPFKSWSRLSKQKIKSKKMSAKEAQLYNIEQLHHQFVSTVLTQIQWSAHLHILNKTKTAEEKLFYILLSIREKLSVREIERQLNSGIYERSMLGKQIVSTVVTQLPEGFFKDPYIFEFLNLPDGHSEKDLENALILNLKKFILEIGKGFTYMGNQYRLQVGNKDYSTDLLFYHRDLQCLYYLN